MDTNKNDKSTDEMIKRIYHEMVGDEYTEGVIPKLNRMDGKISKMNDKIEKHENRFKILYGIIFGISTIIGALITFGRNIIGFFKDI